MQSLDLSHFETDEVEDMTGMFSSCNKLNYINLAEKNRIPTNVIYYNPRVILEWDRFYIVVSVDDEYAPKKKIEATSNIIGIDVNVKAIVTSENVFYKAVTFDKNYKKALMKEKRAQNKLSRKYIKSKELKKWVYRSVLIQK